MRRPISLAGALALVGGPLLAILIAVCALLVSFGDGRFEPKGAVAQGVKPVLDAFNAHLLANQREHAELQAAIVLAQVQMADALGALKQQRMEDKLQAERRWSRMEHTMAQLRARFRLREPPEPSAVTEATP